MPTGYTADIKDGISFETYAMNCARAFGACITLRDEPSGGDRIPDVFEASDYHQRAADKARAELHALLAMTPDDHRQAAAKAWEEAEATRLRILEDRRRIRTAYETMLERVNAWNPPTPDHVELHCFMRTQIEQSIEFDCDVSHWLTPAPRPDASTWVADEAQRINRNIEYHEEQHAQELQRAADRTAWVQSLRSSLLAQQEAA
jgi:hypothetical protein